MAPAFARPAIGPSHFAPLAFQGSRRFSFDCVGSSCFGFNRFSFSCLGFDCAAVGRAAISRFSFNRFGSNRFGGNGWNANAWNQGQLGLVGFGYGGYSPSYATSPSAPIIIGGGGPPVAINLYAGGGTGEVGRGGAGACVIHLLKYDQAGNYTGEEQIPQC
jgi:hypothetical protein